MGRWEWIILELGFLGLLIWELISIRRTIRKSKLDQAAQSSVRAKTPEV